MRQYRFFVGDTSVVDRTIEITEKRLLHQWGRVLRFTAGSEVVLFNAQQQESVYSITELKKDAAQLVFIHPRTVKVPQRRIYLCFSLLKKDKNEWVLQKATELGVSAFIPIIADRTEKTGFDSERAHKIVLEAAEQCGRGDIPTIQEPMQLRHAIEDVSAHADIFVTEQGSTNQGLDNAHVEDRGIAIAVGPEGGWSDAEKDMFKTKQIQTVAISDFTLRAETACVVAVAVCAITPV